MSGARLLLAAIALSACTRPAEERAARELSIGAAAIDGATVEVAGGLAHVRALAPAAPGVSGTIDLWAQAPVIELIVTLDQPGPWTLTLANALADADARPSAGTVTYLAGPRPTVRVWQLDLPAGATSVRIAPPDAGDATTPWRFAVMGDIQDALPTVHEVFARIEAEPGVRFVLSTGDLVHRGRDDEWALYARQLETLDVPYYTTIGNHELWGDVEQYFRAYGRANLHFRYRGAVFTLVDSASATIDPTVDGWLDAWLADAAGELHLFATHYPPVDPVGVRQGSFASKREGQALLARLAAAGVDLTVYGHVHTYLGFANAGIPAHISGGGGAEPMRFDGIDRHFLVIDVEPAAPRFLPARVVRVD